MAAELSTHYADAKSITHSKCDDLFDAIDDDCEDYCDIDDDDYNRVKCDHCCKRLCQHNPQSCNKCCPSNPPPPKCDDLFDHIDDDCEDYCDIDDDDYNSVKCNRCCDQLCHANPNSCKRCCPWHGLPNYWTVIE